MAYGYDIYTKLCEIRQIKDEELKLKREELKQLELRNKIALQKLAIEQDRNIVELEKIIQGIEFNM